MMTAVSITAILALTGWHILRTVWACQDAHARTRATRSPQCPHVRHIVLRPIPVPRRIPSWVRDHM